MNTSTQAFEAVKPTIPTLKTRVLEAIKSAGETGMIAEEIGNRLPDVPFGSVSTRPNELRKAGLIRIAGTRKNSRNRDQNIYVAV